MQKTLRRPVRWIQSACLVLGALAIGCGGKDAPPARVLIVGWDGATFDLLDPLLEGGRLPHLGALIAAGRTADLESTRIPISSAAWPTLTTGTGPGEHGVYSFFRPTGEGYDVRLVNATDVDAPPIWRRLSARGRTVNVWGVPVTYPPEPVSGTLVAGMLSPFDAEYAYPAGTADRLRSTGFVPDLGIWRQDQIADLEEVHRQLALKEREVVDLLSKPGWDFSMVAFKSLDVLCHRPNLRLDGPEITGVLERLDGILGAMVAAAGENTVVVVVSDHGFASYRRTFNLHRWLVESGWSLEAEGAEVGGSIAGPLAEAQAAARGARLGSLDMAATRAFADASEGPYGGIRLNLSTREADGIVERADLDGTLDALEASLRTIEFPEGIPIVEAVYRGADLYPGPQSDGLVPDLIVEFGAAWRCVNSTFGDVMNVGTAPFPDHALDGIFVASGAPIAHDPARGRLQLVDVAPFALHAMNEPIPSRMNGDPHPESFVSPRKPRRIPDAEDPGSIPASVAFDGVETEASNGEVEGRVDGLGYGK